MPAPKVYSPCLAAQTLCLKAAKGVCLRHAHKTTFQPQGTLLASSLTMNQGFDDKYVMSANGLVLLGSEHVPEEQSHDHHHDPKTRTHFPHFPRNKPITVNGSVRLSSQRILQIVIFVQDSLEQQQQS